MASSTKIFIASLVGVSAVGNTANPIAKVTQLLSDLDAKIVAEGQAAQALYAELSEFCGERSANLAFEIKTAKAEKASLEAVINEQAARKQALEEKINSLAADIATDSADLQSATTIRAKENADFVAEEKELTDAIDTLERAIRILEKHASMVQIKNAGSIGQALDALVQASALSTSDAKQLTALMQGSQASDDSDNGAPEAEVYVGHSGDIVQALQNILDKANEQLATARNVENKNRHNFELLKQSLQDEVKFGEKDMAQAKKNAARSSEAKLTAEGNLAQTKKLLSSDSAALDSLKIDCVTKVQNYEAEAKSRGEELNAIREASKVIAEETGGAEKLSYDLNQVSLLQRSSMSSGSELANFGPVRLVRSLAEKEHSSVLAQLAMRMASVMHAKARTGADPFSQVKGMVIDMIEKLESQAAADATHKAYCDKELAETKVKQADKNAEISRISTSVDGMAARSAQLRREIAALQKSLAELAAAQAEMNKLRGEEKEAFVKDKANMQQGIKGVRVALEVLLQYYASKDKAHESSDSDAHPIIGLLQVVESDFNKGLADVVATEEAAVVGHAQQTKENEIEKTMKEADVKYSTQEATGLDNAIQEASSDREGVKTELSAVKEYRASLEKQCIAKAETFAERKGRFESELAGLKDALSILDGQAVLLQKSRRSFLRRSM